MMSSVYMIVFTVGLAVQILAAASCEEGTVRFNPDLRLNMGPYAGYVQVCINNIWAGLCDGNFNRVEAIVVCKQLGYIGSIDKGYNKTVVSGKNIKLKSKDCKGYEKEITKCNLNKTVISMCTKSHWVECLLTNCTTGSLRLVGGASYREGRVEVCVDGRWGTVCYNEELAGTVCQQLGFGSQGAKANHTNIPVPKVNCTIGKMGIDCGNIPTQQDIVCEAFTVQCARNPDNCSAIEPTGQSMNTTVRHSLPVCTTMNSSKTNLPSFNISSTAILTSTTNHLSSIVPSKTNLPSLNATSTSLSTTSEPRTTLHNIPNIVGVTKQPTSSTNTNNDAHSTTQQTPSITTNSIDNTEQPTCTCSTNDYNTDQAGGTKNTTLAGGTNNTALGVLIGLLALLEIATVIGCVLCILRRKTTPPKPPRARGTSFINESYETNPPIQSEYSTVGPHYDVLKRNEPPKIEPYQPAHPPPVGGVSDDEFYNAEDHTYAAVSKKKEGGAN